MRVHLSPEQRTAATAPLGRPEDVAPGVSGKGLSGGRPYGYDTNRRLGDHRVAIADYRQMAKSESSVQWPWHLRLNGLLTPTWGVTRTERTSDAAFELCQRQFGDGDSDGELHRPLESILAQMYLSDLYGFAVMVPEWESDGSVYWVRDVVNRLPDTIDGWDLDDSERLVGVVQVPDSYTWTTQPRRDGRNRFIPANECLIVVRNPEARTDLTGAAMLRPVHPLWKELVNCRNNGAIADQRWAIPTPRVRSNVLEALKAASNGGASALKSVLGDTPAKYIENQASALNTQAQRYVANQVGALSDSDLVSFEAFGADSYDPTGNLARQQHLSAEIARVFTAQFMLLGQNGAGGSYALGGKQMDAYQQSLVNTIERVGRVLNGPDRRGGGLVGRLCAYNLPGIRPEEMPTLRPEGLETRGYLERLAELPALFERGALTATDDVEHRLRSDLGLPPLSDGFERTPAERAADPSSVRGVIERGRAAPNVVNRPNVGGGR